MLKNMTETTRAKFLGIAKWEKSTKKMRQKLCFSFDKLMSMLHFEISPSHYALIIKRFFKAIFVFLYNYDRFAFIGCENFD